MNNSNRKYNMGSIKMELIQKMEFAGLYVGGNQLKHSTRVLAHGFTFRFQLDLEKCIWLWGQRQTLGLGWLLLIPLILTHLFLSYLPSDPFIMLLHLHLSSLLSSSSLLPASVAVCAKWILFCAPYCWLFFPPDSSNHPNTEGRKWWKQA